MLNLNQASKPRQSKYRSTTFDAMQLIIDCAHISTEYAQQHEQLMHDEGALIKTEIAAELKELTDHTYLCCHLDRGWAEHHELQQSLLPLPKHQLASDLSIVSKASIKLATCARSLFEKEKTEPSGAGSREEAAPMSQAERQDSTGADKAHPQPGAAPAPIVKTTGEKGADSTRTYTEDEDQFSTTHPEDFEECQKVLARIVRRLVRVFSMSDSDAQIVTDGIYKRCNNDLGETKRIICNLLADTRSKTDVHRKTRPVLRRNGHPNQFAAADSESSSGLSCLPSSTIVASDGLDRPSKFIPVKSEKLGSSCLINAALDPTEVTRIPQLELKLVAAAPPDFELVRNWRFELPPVRLLRLSTQRI